MKPGIFGTQNQLETIKQKKKSRIHESNTHSHSKTQKGRAAHVENIFDCIDCSKKVSIFERRLFSYLFVVRIKIDNNKIKLNFLFTSKQTNKNMGKHKHKSKSKKIKKHKNSKYDKSSDSDSDDSAAEIVWTESVCDNEVQAKESINNDQGEDLFDFITKTSKNNTTKQTVADKNKNEIANNEQRIRYSRELNSFFRDDINKRFIDDPDELKKIHESQNEEQVEKEEEEPEEGDENVSDAELNSLNAKLLKAKMLGNTELANELKAKLDQLKRTKSTKSVKYVNKTIKQKDEKTEDSMSVKELYLKTKNITAREEAMRFVATTSKIRTTDDEYDGVRGAKKAKFDTVGFERIRFTASNNDDYKCDWCLECRKANRHLILKFPEQLSHCYATLTSYKPLINNVCMIVSRNHSYKCSLEADQDSWTEIRQMMRKLSGFFNNYYNCITVFMETFFVNKKRNQNLSNHHFVIECYPIKKRFETDAKIYFHVCIIHHV